MSPSECLRILELPPSATADEIKQAYRRLAQQYHPDKHAGHADARDQFIRIAEAYRLLTRASRVARTGRRVGTCSACGRFGEVVRNLGGVVVCPKCALGCRQRYLPLPVLVVVRCTVPLALLILSAYLLWEAIERPSLGTATLAFVTAIGALGSLATLCLRVTHCLPPPRLRRSDRPYP